MTEGDAYGREDFELTERYAFLLLGGSKVPQAC
jgi:hypothetical protein